jgi:hypothetical protein
MSTGRPHADQAPIASTAGNADRLLQEALRKALLRSLCHKMHSLWDRQQQYTPQFQRWERADLVAEMIGDMVGLTADEVYQAFDNGDCTGAGLIQQLEPLLARDRGSWMTEGCL